MVVGVYGVSEAAGRGTGEALQRIVTGANQVHRGHVRMYQAPGVSVGAYPRHGGDVGGSVLDREDVLVIVSGHLVHPTLTAESSAALIGRLLDTGNFPKALAGCLGEFAIVLVDKRSGEVSLVTDYLGVRPLLYAITDTGLLFGSNVWPMFDSGRIAPEVDSDALASWIVLNYTQGTSTLFKQIRKVPPKTVMRFRGKQIIATPYGLRTSSRPDVGNDLIEQVHDIVSRTARHLTRGHPSVAVLLSGGYDSRYVACLLKRQGVDCLALTVPYESGDAELTPLVASRLDMPLRSMPVSGSLDDAYGDPVRWSAFGFPVGKHVTCLPVERFAVQVPAVDGFLGGHLMRGGDTDGHGPMILRRRASESLPEAAVRAEMWLPPEAVFSPTLARRTWKRAEAQTRSLLDAMDGPDERKISLWLLQNRQANWIHNNHLQYLETTETFHPFYSQELIELHLEGAHATWELYEHLFDRLYPEVADVRHSRHVPRSFHASHRWSWFHWRRSPGLIGTLLSRDWARRGIRRGHVLPRVGAYAAGVYRWAYVVRYLHQVATLMRRLDGNGIQVDWDTL